MCKLQIVQTNGISQEHVFIATFAPCTYEIFRRHLMRSSSFEIVILWDRHLMRSSCEIEIIFWVCMSQNEMRMHHVYLHIQSVCLDLFLLFLLLLHTCRPAGTLIQVFFLFQRGIPLHKSYRRRNNFREIQCLKRAFSAFSRSFSTFFASTNSPGFILELRLSRWQPCTGSLIAQILNCYFAVSSPNSGPTNPAKSLRY